MCSNAYEKKVERTGKIMVLCRLKDDELNELLKLCISQRYCDEKDKYIPHKQQEGCRNYE